MLVMFALTYHEPDAPRWVWLSLLAAVALMRVLHEGKFRKAASWYRNASLLVLALIALPFAVDQVRQAIYPVLEQPSREIAPTQVVMNAGLLQREMAPAAPAPAEKFEADQRQGELAGSGESSTGERAKEFSPSMKFSRKGDAKPATLRQAAIDEIDPKAMIQTGPGLPQWQWRQYPLQWSGPVERSQQMTLWLTSPAVNAFLNLVRVALVALVAFCIVELKLPRFGMRAPGAAALVIVAAILFMPYKIYAASPPAPSSDGVPINASLLDELKTRLTAPHDCTPNCAEISRLAIEASGSALTLRLAVSAVVDTAVPLPGRRNQWRPRQALLDGRPGAVVHDAAGALWMLVSQGAHQVVLEGPLGDAQQLSLPLKPRLATVNAPGYRVDGIDDSGVPDEAIQFTALRAQAGERAVVQGQLPSFVRIERTLALGLQWTIATRVSRISANTAPVLVEVPLLPGEAVVSEHVRVAKGKALALLPAQVGQIEWRSTLKEQPQIVLASAKQLAWVEAWRFDVGPQWHAQFSGIPVVHHQSEGRWLPEWRPWPGEELKAQIARPEGIAGRTLTIDRTELSVTPGIRATDATLSLAMRSSRGGEHTIKLPESAELLSAAIDGKSQPLRLEGNALRIPIVPGAQTVKLGWREARGIGAYFATAPFVAGASGVNAWTKVNVSPDRWVLWVRGPRVGPAILLWGVVLALIPIAIGLSRVGLTPLSARDWFLLGLGLTQSPIAIGIFLVIWLFALGLRG